MISFESVLAKAKVVPKELSPGPFTPSLRKVQSRDELKHPSQLHSVPNNLTGRCEHVSEMATQGDIDRSQDSQDKDIGKELQNEYQIFEEQCSYMDE
jgi:hypothetical protein